MKYKDYLRQQQQVIDPNRGNPIFCPDCGELIGYDKDYMFMVIMTPIVCPKCDEIIIYPNMTYNTCGVSIQ